MMRAFAAALAAGAVALLIATTATGRSDATTTLKGKVGPGFTITLTKGGTKVRSLKAGTYRFVVSDRSPAHNFVVEKSHGSHVERTITSVRFTGTKTMTVKLTKGEWEFECTPHEDVMHGDFVVK
jgi:plastocyanin